MQSAMSEMRPEIIAGPMPRKARPLNVADSIFDFGLSSAGLAGALAASGAFSALGAATFTALPLVRPGVRSAAICLARGTWQVSKE